VWAAVRPDSSAAWTMIGWALAAVGHAVAWLISPR